jgi:hypothetical protein
MTLSFRRLTEEQVMRMICVTCLLTLPLLIVGTASFFSPDAWTAYELSNTVFGDFYRQTTAREYSTEGLYSSAFPPIWPVIMALFKPLTGNIYGSFLAAFVAYGMFALAAEWFGRRAFGRRGIGMLSAVLLSSFPGFLREVASGRDRALLLFELAIAGGLLVRLHKATWKRSALIGFVAGAMAMTRFDALPTALIILTGAVILGVRRTNILVMVAFFAVAISPWIGYSRTHFNVNFASSNTWTAISVEKGDVYDYYVTPPRTLHDAPREWVHKVVNNVRPILGALVTAIGRSVFLPVLLVLAAFVAGSSRVRGEPPDRVPASVDRPALAILVLAAAGPYVGYLVTGYHDQRYFSITIWVLELFALAYLAQGGEQFFRVTLVALAAASLIWTTLRPFTTPNAKTPLQSYRSQLDRSPVDTLVNCLRRAGGDPANSPVLFQQSRTLLPTPWTFGALAGWRTLPLPTNWAWLDRAARESFMRKYHAAFVVGDPVLPAGPGRVGEVPIACPIPLSRVVSSTP